VIRARRECNRDAQGRNENGSWREGFRTAIAELAGRVVTPTAQRPIDNESTGELVSGGNRDGIGDAGNRYGSVGIHGCAASELPTVVGAPAKNLPAHRQATGMRIPG
jgi:hypothetical protein